MPPKGSNKRKAKSANNGKALTPPDRETWPGWVEMESEPAFFNVMLKDMGVHGVKINEVYSLDDTDLAVLPQPVHALIFLFRYRETDKDDLETECPEHVWYAEQTPDFACATVALLNIINNIPGLQMGRDLRNFKDFTQDLTPRLRGDAIDDFAFVKRIHNSFASDADILQADEHIKAKAAKARKRQAIAKAQKTKADKAAARNAKSSPPEETPDETPKGTRASARARKPSTKAASDESSKVTPQSGRSPANLEGSDEKLPNGGDASVEKDTSPPVTPSKSNGKKAIIPTSSNEKDDSGKQSQSPRTSPRTQKGKPNEIDREADEIIKDEANNSSPSNPKANIGKKLKLNAPKTKPQSDPNAEYTASVENADSQSQPRRSARQPQPRKSLQPAAQDEQPASDDSADEEGFHFCAYMPIGDHVWKLDGMDKFPQDMGPIEDGADWLSIAQPALQGRIAQYAAGAIEFNLMAVVHDPMVVCVEALAANVEALRAVEAKLADVVEDWRELVDETDLSADTIESHNDELGLQNVDVERAEMTTSDQKALDEAEDLTQLLALRDDVILQQCGLRHACAEERQSVLNDTEKAEARRNMS